MSNTEVTHNVGTRLRSIRLRADMSQQQFADLLGLKLRTYQSYERAERPLPIRPGAPVRGIIREPAMGSRWNKTYGLFGLG